MKYEILLKKSFWFGLALFLLLTIVAVLPLEIGFYFKGFLIALAIVLYVAQQLFQWPEFTEGLNRKLIEKTLSSVEQLKKLDVEQRFRSNVFFYDARRKVFYIKYGYNMDKYDDKNILIPTNMGCTGEAWRDRKQVWGDHKKIFSEGSYRVPNNELNKVPNDLQWICSTPITDDTGNVRAVLNFDGNKVADANAQEEIKKHGSVVAEELKVII